MDKKGSWVVSRWIMIASVVQSIHWFLEAAVSVSMSAWCAFLVSSPQYCSPSALLWQNEKWEILAMYWNFFFLSPFFWHLSSCWTRNYNMNYWLIIRLPILIAIGVSMEHMQQAGRFPWEKSTKSRYVHGCCACPKANNLWGSSRFNSEMWFFMKPNWVLSLAFPTSILFV